MRGSMRKWQSRRWWICLWAMVMTTAIITWLMIEPRGDIGWTGAAIALFQAIILGYLASSTVTKPTIERSEGNGQ